MMGVTTDDGGIASLQLMMGYRGVTTDEEYIMGYNL